MSSLTICATDTSYYEVRSLIYSTLSFIALIFIFINFHLTSLTLIQIHKKDDHNFRRVIKEGGMSNWTKLMDRSPPRVQLLLRGHLVTLENVLKALSHPIAGSYHGFHPNRPISHATAQEQEHEE